MKISIHGHLEKIRFHISQKILENFEDFFTFFFIFLFSLQNSILRLHTNLLTDIDMEKWRENSFSYQPLTKPFKNLLTSFLVISFRNKPQCRICLDLWT